MAAPQPLLELFNSLQLVGVPQSAPAGALISPRILPDPAPGGPLQAALAALATNEPPWEIETDLGLILEYIAQTLGIDAAAVLKDVEFNRPVENTADVVEVSSPVVHDLPHYVPSPAGAPAIQLSQLVKGLIGRARARLRYRGKGWTATGTIRRLATLEEPPTIHFNFILRDEAGAPLAPGIDYFKSASPIAPNFVLLPVVVDSSDGHVSFVRRNFSCDVQLTYKMPGQGSAADIADAGAVAARYANYSDSTLCSVDGACGGR